LGGFIFLFFVGDGKGSKESDYSLMSNENLSQKFPFSSWAQAQVTWAKMA